jgi:hypothetical protein
MVTNRDNKSFGSHPLVQPGNLRIRFFLIISRIFTFSLTERTSRLVLDVQALPASLLLRFGVIITINKDFVNTNTAITRQLIRTARTLEAEWSVKRGHVDKERWVKYWARLGCWISPCYGLFSLGARFGTYETFISLIFSISFFGPRPNADMGVRLYSTFVTCAYLLCHGK